MRLLKLILSDISFQWKYGFYYLYIIITVMYLFVLSMLQGEVKNTVGIIMILSDPATMGMFFMGAIVLLEKSQRVLDSIAVSPVTAKEYIFSKVISIGIVSLLVGGTIILAKGTDNMLLACFGVFVGSVIFSLCGLIVGGNIRSINQYVVATMPFEILGFAPPIAYMLGFTNKWMLLHPCCILIRYMDGNGKGFILLTIILFAWVAILYLIAYHSIDKMFKRLGGTHL